MQKKRHRGLEEQQRVLGNVACWPISNCQVNRELTVKNTSHLQASATPYRKMLTAGWLVTLVYGVCSTGQNSPESSRVVPWTGTCGQPKVCFISFKMLRGRFGADHAWRCCAEAHREVFDLGGRGGEASGKLSLQHSVSVASFLHYVWPWLHEKRRKSTLQTRAVQGLRLGAGLSFVYCIFYFFLFFLCVCVRVQRWNHCHRLGGASSWRISSSGWDCSLCLPFVVHFPWLFLNWSVFQVKAGLRPPPAACKTWQLGWGGRWGDKAVAFDVFLAVLLWWLNFNKSSPRSADHCSQ